MTRFSLHSLVRFAYDKSTSLRAYRRNDLSYCPPAMKRASAGDEAK